MCDGEKIRSTRKIGRSKVVVVVFDSSNTVIPGKLESLARWQRKAHGFTLRGLGFLLPGKR
jgi:hypothetical protein